MASLEKAERLGGVGLLGIPAFDFFVWALDTYARGELLMSLSGQLPGWLLNPAFMFLCLCGGLGLLYLSHQRQLQRILTRPSKLVGVEQYQEQEPSWLLPLLCVALIALVAAPILALGYSLAYKGTLPPHAHLHPLHPVICKTADCFSSEPKPAVSTEKKTIINAPGGIPIIDNRGTVNNPTVNNFGPVPRRLSEQTKTELIGCLKKQAGSFSIDALINSGEAYAYA